mmetsp:Transcript_1292/g.2924  ORF Transcript_1292/g.2924 Transcript_1292/m.2924 type:complete len:93 (+) Transcript_1292:312-590(+)
MERRGRMSCSLPVLSNLFDKARTFAQSSCRRTAIGFNCVCEYSLIHLGNVNDIIAMKKRNHEESELVFPEIPQKKLFQLENKRHEPFVVHNR